MFERLVVAYDGSKPAAAAAERARVSQQLLEHAVVRTASSEEAR